MLSTSAVTWPMGLGTPETHEYDTTEASQNEHGIEIIEPVIWHTVISTALSPFQHYSTLYIRLIMIIALSLFNITQHSILDLK